MDAREGGETAGSPLIRADTVIEGLSTPERAAEWSAARRALLDATPVTSVGTLDGTGPDLLGSIAAAAGDTDGNGYILDGIAEEVLVFDAAGDFLHRVGGKGEGPEEFVNVRDLVRLSDGRLVVGQSGAPAKVLEPRPGDSTYVAAWSFPYPRVEVRVMSGAHSRHAVTER